MTTEKRLAAQLKVPFTPTLIFLDERGEVVLRLNGYHPPHQFEAALDYAAGNIPRSEYLGRQQRAAAPDPSPLPSYYTVAFKRHVLEQIAKFDFYRFAVSATDVLTAPDGSRTSAGAWARALNVGYVPTLVLLDARGREVLRVEAYLRAFHVAGAFDYVSSGAYASEPSFQRFLHAKAERLRARGERVDLWN